MATENAILENALHHVPFWERTRASLEEIVLRLIEPPAGFPEVNFRAPIGDPGLLGPGAVSWRVMSNPVSVFVGGVAAVILQLAEPRIRQAAWHDSSFRRDPIGRMRRTGLAAMVTTYGSRADVERITARIRRLHESVIGTTSGGEAYRATDAELLRFVFTSASWGFLRAHVAFASPKPLSRRDRDRYYAEGMRIAPYYGLREVPTTGEAVDDYLRAMRPRLVGDPAVKEFVKLVSQTPIVSNVARPVQRLLVGAALEILPRWARRRLGLEEAPSWLRSSRLLAGRMLAPVAGVVMRSGPAQEACRRMGVPADRLTI